ncbi:3-hydroxyacyl-CoA dehydrogenase family protein [Membranihabitans maritimus]|uniref:3-hydroxyacyl-CoA dehydrogenase family protein n=1 Tax=Membranihabitans maritimus TaxID=2904244 RepID=UPI001F1FF89F|nr:3-hydroxyacyl-CoA dehydrogenase family protein [Membranihabitans maritimus]
MNTNEIPVGIVGLGLMGCSITTCLLMAGHPVVGVAPIPDDLEFAEKRIRKHFEKSRKNGLIDKEPDHYIKNLNITQNYNQLSSCRIVLECTLEDIKIKESVFRKIEENIDEGALLTSNTSAIPITQLQKLTQHPERFFGLHWMEPSHTTRFLEIICGDLSEIEKGEYLYALSHKWNKEPILVRKDIPGFITNRIMYSMYREALFLVEGGYATIEDVDRACRNVPGYYMTLAGIFRWMDLTGVKAYHNVMKNLLPTLSNNTEVPKLIDDIVKSGGNGVSNANGFYEYSEGEAELWEETYSEFSYKIRELALQYPFDIVKEKMESKKKSS